MRKVLVVLSTLALIVPVSGGAQDDPVQFEIYGYSYFTPPEEVGTVVTVVGQLEAPVGFSYPIPVDFANNEYTFYIQTTITDVQAGPFTTTYTYADADFFIYEDPSKNADYGINPPNSTSPSTFLDGVLILQGTLSNITRLDYNAGFPEPTVVADCTFTGGSLYDQLFQANNWTFHGGLSSTSMGIPEGYQRDWATKIVFSGPLPSRSSTWGGIKALYGTE